LTILADNSTSYHIDPSAQVGGSFCLLKIMTENSERGAASQKSEATLLNAVQQKSGASFRAQPRNLRVYKYFCTRCFGYAQHDASRGLLQWSAALILPLLLLLSACSSEVPKTPQEDPIAQETATYLNQIAGEAQGTTYHISYLDTSQQNIKAQVDSILLNFDYALSNWNSNSTLTAINSTEESSIAFLDTFGYVAQVCQMSLDVYQRSEHAFDPTVLPLVNAWGFGFNNEEEMNDQRVATLLESVGYGLLVQIEADDHNATTITKEANVKLDFNAIAQGYSVDVICDYMNTLGLTDYVVEIGGELRASGQNAQGNDWRVQVDKPIQSDETNRERQAVIAIPDGKSLATSGSYRKFREKDGIKLSHTIDPRTGYPVAHSLLSTTVLANNCGTADAYATVFMVFGVERTIEFLTENADMKLEVYLVYSNDAGELETYSSEGMKPIIEEVKEEN
jgi:thiamine biosynthesis lipoprotein